ncbi:MAG: hypothetical protein ACJ77B_04125 [Chloroflexota bacterium]
MSVLRSRGGVAACLAMTIALAACSGAASPTTGGGGGGGGAATPGAAASSGGGAPAGNPNNPAIADGAYTTGKLHADITGGVTTTIDVPLQGGLNMTAAGSTILNYADASGDGGGVALSTQGNAVTISSKAVTTAGASNTSGASGTCSMTVTQADPNHLSGTFDCKGLPGFVVDGSKQVVIDMRGTFDAAR